MDIRKIFALLFVGGLVVFMISHFIKSERERILEQLSSLEEILYIAPEEAPLKKAARLKTAAQYFTKTVEIAIDLKYRDEKLIRTRQELVDSLLFLSQRLDRMSIEFVDTHVKINEDETATIATTVKVTYEEDDLFQAVEFEIFFVKEDGQWLISKLKNIQPFEL